MKIYTKGGDKGETSLFGGTRVPKFNIRIESYGTVDELNANIGMIRDQDIDDYHKTQLQQIQKNLFTLGAELATEPKKAKLKNGKDRLNITVIKESDIEHLENEIDQMNKELPEMTHFILPGGHPTVSYCHLARCVCRRAERNATALFEHEKFDPAILQYLNRLSDYLFVLSRKVGQELDAEEVQWLPEKH